MTALSKWATQEVMTTTSIDDLICKKYLDLPG